MAEQRLGEYRSQLSDAERARYDLEQLLVKSKNELASMNMLAATATKPKPHVLEHLPTPMARTVFGGELHFRLLGHRLTYVPWDEMIERLKADARNHLSKLAMRRASSCRSPRSPGSALTTSCGRLTPKSKRAGTARHSGIELEQVYLVDAEPNLGQPVAQALAPGSEFRGRIRRRPQSTTITFWVYPDSFDDFRLFKAELFKLGDLSAARPMPSGEPIAGSPSGSRSSAE